MPKASRPHPARRKSWMRKASFAAVAVPAGFETHSTTQERTTTLCQSCRLFPSKYLKHDDIADGETVTISEVRVEEVGQDKQEKPVLYFNEHHKGAILNVTNARAIAKVYGDEESDWQGKKLTLVTIPTPHPTGEPTTSICMKPGCRRRKRKRRPK